MPDLKRIVLYEGVPCTVPDRPPLEGWHPTLLHLIIYARASLVLRVPVHQAYT